MSVVYLFLCLNVRHDVVFRPVFSNFYLLPAGIGWYQLSVIHPSVSIQVEGSNLTTGLVRGNNQVLLLYFEVGPTNYYINNL